MADVDVIIIGAGIVLLVSFVNKYPVQGDKAIAN
jgi:hypothetical protein